MQEGRAFLRHHQAQIRRLGMGAQGWRRRRGWRRLIAVIMDRQRFIFLDQLRADQAFIGDGASQERRRIAQHLHHAEEARRLAAVEGHRGQDGFQLDHAIVGSGSDGGQANRLAGLERLAQQGGKRQAGLGFPMAQETGALQFETETLVACPL